MKTIEETVNGINEVLKNCDTHNCMNDYISKETIEDILKDYDDETEAYQAIFNVLEENSAFDVEIIYYSNAIKYLTENDTSLRESISLAEELGFELTNINSELLASLHASSSERELFQESEDELLEELEAYFSEK